ncbi:hypothetical protein JB92DRAFT_3105428 [Gautieria morchelliformis]|nr:hypothetical protein JB92DRAFT_3105428 [Gautieria morchelliformis]
MRPQGKFTQGGKEAASTIKTQSETPAWTKSGSPLPVQDMAEASTTTTPGAFGMMSLTLPLTRAFHESDDSKYSEDSDEIDDEADEGQEQHTGTPVLPAQCSLSSRSPDQVNHRSMSKSPALATSIQVKFESEWRTGSPNVEADRGAAYPTHLSVVTSLADIDHDVSILNESPVRDKSPGSRPWSPADDMHL